MAELPFSRLLQRLSRDPAGSRLSLQSADGLETDSPDHASGRQNDRCVAKAQHMLYEGLGLARALSRVGVVCMIQKMPCESWCHLPGLAHSGSGSVQTLAQPPILQNDFLIYPPWCVHISIYRLFHVMLTSTVLFSIKKVRHSWMKKSRKVLWCSLKRKSHLIPVCERWNEFLYPVTRSSSTEKIMTLNGVKLRKQRYSGGTETWVNRRKNCHGRKMKQDKRRLNK